MIVNEQAYRAAHEHAAWFDLSDRAKVELVGRDAREFLHNLCTQDIKKLAVGATCEAFLTTNKARVLAHVWITHRAADELLMDFAVGQNEAVMKHLNHYLISERVEIADRTHDLGMVRVIGPKAAEVLSKIEPVSPQTIVRRHRILATDGFDLIGPIDTAFRDRLHASHAVAGDRATYAVLRIEAGLPEYGPDIDDARLAMEVNRPEAISYAKGCYLGQETVVMARDRGQVNRLLMGVRGSASLQRGVKLFRDGAEVGHVTSAIDSPRLAGRIGLAYLRRGAWDAGTCLTVDAPGNDAVIVSALPFAVN
jgi:folate-binding protein YgfZ